MGKTSVKKRIQEPLEIDTIVYFIGFTKNKNKKQIFYLCKAKVVSSPSPFNKAPHKVAILSVALSSLDPEGSEADGRQLLAKEVQIPISRLNTELHSWLQPKAWWN